MTPFELSLSVPPDPRFAETMRLVAVQAVQQVGGSEAEAAAFGADVERAMRECMTPPGKNVEIAVNVQDGEVEMVMTCGRTIRIAYPVTSKA